MKKLIDKGLKVFKQEGMKQFIIKSARFSNNRIPIVLKSTVDPLYVELLPDTKEYTIDSYTAKFDLSAASLNGDFRYVLNSENKPITTLLESFSPDDVFYDVGANVGIYSCFAGNIIQDGRITSFEPHPVALKHLETNLSLNNIDAQICRYALGESRDEVQLQTSSQGAGHSLTNSYSQEGDVTTKQIPGDEVVESEGIPQPNVVKIDVEGYELGVIQGARDILRADECREIYVEVHPKKMRKYGFNVGDIYKEMEEIGFEIEELDKRRVGDREQVYLRGTK